jgi:hypothetical protein
MTYRIKNYIPAASEAPTSAVYTFRQRVHAIRVDSAGTIRARLRGDDPAAWRTYTLAAGDYAFGDFAAVIEGTVPFASILGLRFAEE